jgi:NAD-dependent dihydropyrimidine dehydrogenase PreA subunit
MAHPNIIRPLASPPLGEGFLSYIQRNPFRYLFPPRLEQFNKASTVVSMAMAQCEGFQFFRINFSRCIFCGFCEDACPTYSIQLTPDFEMGEYERQNMVYERSIFDKW